MSDPFVLGGLRMAADPAAADWIVAGVRNFEYDVGSLVPVGFEAYARLFHPAARRSHGHADPAEVSWAEVAAANHRVAHAGMEWIAITGDWSFMTERSQPGVWDASPSIGSLPVRQAAALAGILERFTRTPAECWFAVWDGYGGAEYPRGSGPIVQMPSRPMVLFSGPLAAVTTSFEEAPSDQRASLWWPDDRAWCVGTDVDLMSTYIGGSGACIAAVLADGRLETLPVSVDQSITWMTDVINPTPVRSRGRRPAPPEDSPTR